MTNEDLKITIAGLLPTASFEEGAEWLTVAVEPTDWKGFAPQLRSTSLLEFDFLFCLTCVDWKTHLTMVYHFTSTSYRQPLVVKIKLDRNNPAIETVSDIWRTAEFHEREVYDFYGVNFLHHPDLRILLLPEGWEGRNPLRKDFEDAVNMIKL